MFALLLLPPELTSPSATTYILCIFCDQHPLEVRSRVPLITVAGVGESGDPRRKWEEMGERERERERKKSVAFVSKMI